MRLSHCCFIAMLITSAAQSTVFAETNETSASGLQLEAVIISNIGGNRVPNDPVMLYVNESGSNKRYLKFGPKYEYVKGEKCDVAVLDRFLAAVKSGEHWVAGGHGTTEFVFYRSDKKYLTFFMDRTNAAIAFGAIAKELSADSVVGRYFRIINRSFPPADPASIPSEVWALSKRSANRDLAEQICAAIQHLRTNTTFNTRLPKEVSAITMDKFVTDKQGESFEFAGTWRYEAGKQALVCMGYQIGKEHTWYEISLTNLPVIRTNDFHMLREVLR